MSENNCLIGHDKSEVDPLGLIQEFTSLGPNEPADHDVPDCIVNNTPPVDPSKILAQS